jgi:predicted dehydrogenase
MKSIGMGIVGTGLWGSMHARVYDSTEGVEVRGVMDIVEDKAKELAGEFGAKAYTDHNELLKDDSIDAIAVVTPDFAHYDVCLAAAKAGKHILCEKPLAMTTAECTEIVEAAEKAGVKLMVDFHARWSPPLYKAREAVRKGQLGEPMHCYYRLSDQMWVATDMVKWANKSTVMWFIGSHSIDTVRWLIEDEVVRVYAMSQRKILKGLGVDTPDYYQTCLEFSKGATAVIENSWIMPNTMPNIIDLKCELVGSKGAVYVDGSHHRACEKYTEKDASFPDVLVMPEIYEKQMGFAAESIRHFIDCLKEDRDPMVTGKDGLIVTRVIEAVEESIQKKQPVDVEYPAAAGL